MSGWAEISGSGVSAPRRAFSFFRIFSSSRIERFPFPSLEIEILLRNLGEGLGRHGAGGVSRSSRRASSASWAASRSHSAEKRRSCFPSIWSV